MNAIDIPQTGLVFIKNRIKLESFYSAGKHKTKIRCRNEKLFTFFLRHLPLRIWRAQFT